MIVASVKLIYILYTRDNYNFSLYQSTHTKRPGWKRKRQFKTEVFSVYFHYYSISLTEYECFLDLIMIEFVKKLHSMNLPFHFMALYRHFQGLLNLASYLTDIAIRYYMNLLHFHTLVPCYLASSLTCLLSRFFHSIFFYGLLHTFFIYLHNFTITISSKRWNVCDEMWWWDVCELKFTTGLKLTNIVTFSWKYLLFLHSDLNYFQHSVMLRPHNRAMAIIMAII